jgi:hypothetical protein
MTGIVNDRASERRSGNVNASASENVNGNVSENVSSSVYELSGSKSKKGNDRMASTSNGGRINDLCKRPPSRRLQTQSPPPIK